MSFFVRKSILLLFFIPLFIQFSTFGFGQKSDSDSLGNAYRKSGNEYLGQGKLDSAEYFLLKSVDIFKKSGNKNELASTLGLYAGVFYMKGEFPTVLEKLTEAQKLFHETGNRLGEVKILTNLAQSNMSQMRYKDALKLGLEAIEIYKELKENRQLGMTLNLVSECFAKTGDFENAEKYLSESLPYLEATGDKSMLAHAYHTQVINLISAEEFEKALPVIKKIEELAVWDENSHSFYEFQRTKSKVLVGLGDYKNALSLLQKNLAYFDASGDFTSVQVCYEFLAQCYEGMGQYKNSLTALKTFKSMNDSILGENRMKTIAELETKFETQQKENEILRLENENIQAEVKAAKNRRMFYGSLLGFAGIGLLAFFFYKNAQRTRRLNAILETQKAKIEEKNEMNRALVKEIHHRVKNNLQVLSSLLSLQSDYIKDPAALDAVTEGRDRVQSMGLIHQKLYSGENIASVKMEDYVGELSHHLLDSFGIQNNRIRILQNIDLPPLDVDTALPLGLIINELLTNSLKYAFTDEGEGVIEIDLKIDENQHLALRVSDNGKGQNLTEGTSDSTSFGTDLVKILSKKLKGKITQSSENGFSTIIHFTRFQTKPEV